MYEWGIEIPVNGIASDGSPFDHYEVWMGALRFPDRDHIAALPVEEIDDPGKATYSSTKLIGVAKPQETFSYSDNHALRIRGIMPRYHEISSLFVVFWEALIDRRDTGEPVVVLRRDNRYSSDRITTLYEYTVRQANLKQSVFRDRRGQLMRWSLDMVRSKERDTLTTPKKFVGNDEIASHEK